MNYQEQVLYLAQMNSRNCYPKRLEEIDRTLPYFEIYRDAMRKLSVKSYNYEVHDNAPRMQLWEQYLQQGILPNINSCVNIEGFYNIQLHDSYTYLNDKKSYKDILVFSKFKTDKDPILVPDPYMICNWGNALRDINDSNPWDKKKNKIIFCGTTTGNRNPTLNDRMNLCLWSTDKRDWCDFYITKVAQMRLDQIKKEIPAFDSIYHAPLSLPDQMQYKYHLAIDGNTCKFDVWYYKTHNVVMKYNSKEMLWYYPLLQSDVHYIDVDKENIRTKFDFFNNNPEHAQVLIYNAKKMASALFRPIVHQMYTINLFENIASNK